MPISWSLKPVCDGADMFRPVIIACAWLGAALIVIGVGRKGEE
ncbi:virulence factor TspB C-terminal domain-related protein [Ralstonia pseudosolanacearum]